MKTGVILADHFVKLYQNSRHPNYVVTYKSIPYYLLGAFAKLQNSTIIDFSKYQLSAQFL